VRSTDRTGVEMEALTAVSVAALTLYDMLKAVDPPPASTTSGCCAKRAARPAHGSGRDAVLHG
jgi:molybdenum cofactor biosynthesis enzyme